METTENTGAGPLSVKQAVQALRASREEQAPSEQSQEVEAEAETEEVEDPETTEAVEAVEVDEEGTDQSEEEAEDEAEAEGSPDDLYEVNGVEFTLSQLEEWQKSGLRQDDYTRKTQALSQERDEFASERKQWDAERQQIIGQFREQSAQLKDALATFAVQQDTKPSQSQFETTKEYLEAVEAFDERQAKKQQAEQTYQALMQAEHQETTRREFELLRRVVPEVAQPEGMKAFVDKILPVAEGHGFSADELAAINDHRQLLLLRDLADLKEQAGTREQKTKAAAKKVVKAAKPLPPGSKLTKNQADKSVREANARLRKTGKPEDAVAALRARRARS